MLFQRFVDRSPPKRLIDKIESQNKILNTLDLTGDAKAALLTDSFTRVFQKRNWFSFTQEEAKNFNAQILSISKLRWNDIKIAFMFFERKNGTVTSTIKMNWIQKL